jgi:hypothetical protein
MEKTTTLNKMIGAILIVIFTCLFPKSTVVIALVVWVLCNIAKSIKSDDSSNDPKGIDDKTK